ncbi:MAG: cyclase family protein [Deltaproteobacteria bacterium]|nr:cyclase family protein [Deltaproteobacteria bacterium]
MQEDSFRIIDLSLPIDEKAKEPFPVKVKRLEHGRGGDYLGWALAVSREKSFLEKLKGGLLYFLGKKKISRKTFPDEEFISEERVSASVHTGTHLDAPYHFGTRCEGKEAKKIEDVPLKWCYGDGVVLDFTHKGAGESITREDVEKALKKIDYSVKPFDIVLIYTGADRYWQKREYFFKFPGVSRDATAWLVEQGVKIIGIDALGFDRPFPNMVNDYIKTGDASVLWPAHIYGREKEYCHIERLANLGEIPKPFGFKVACFPVKIRDVGASWIRAVAIV